MYDQLRKAIRTTYRRYRNTTTRKLLAWRFHPEVETAVTAKSHDMHSRALMTYRETQLPKDV